MFQKHLINQSFFVKEKSKVFKVLIVLLAVVVVATSVLSAL